MHHRNELMAGDQMTSYGRSANDTQRIGTQVSTKPPPSSEGGFVASSYLAGFG